MASFMSRIRRVVGNVLRVDQNLWLKRFRRGELAWQRQQRDLGRLPLNESARTVEAATVGGRPAKFVDRGFDALAETNETLDSVRDQLTASRIDFVELPRLSPYRPHIVVDQSDASAVLSALHALPRRQGWNIRVESQSGNRLRASLARTNPERIYKIHAYRRLLARNGRELTLPTEWVTVEPWQRLGQDVPRADGDSHVPGTLRRRIQTRDLNVEYLTPSLWKSSVDNDKRLTWPAPHIYAVTEPVDLVYTWVDGSDEGWHRRKQEALSEINPEAVNETAISHSRFRSREELKYSLRSVEAYASWVNHIYIVTDGQVPPWLNADHPKITVVGHSDIFANPDDLPVFNSHAIESQLHHIPELSERYLYMNDDVFFLQTVDPELFFTSNGLSKFFPSTAPLDVDAASARDMPVLSAAKRGREFILNQHGRTVTNKFRHTPHPQLRSVLFAMEKDFPELFAQVAKSKFRHPDDYSIASSLYHFHAYALGKAIPGTIDYGYLDLANPKAPIQLDWNLNRGDRQVLCVNDTDIREEDEARVTQMFLEIINSRFPIPSSFETL